MHINACANIYFLNGPSLPLPSPSPTRLFTVACARAECYEKTEVNYSLKKVITFVFAKGYFRCHLHHTPAEIKSFQAKTTPCLFDQPPPFDALFFHFANGWRPFNMKTRGRTAISLAISMNTDVSGSLGWRVVRVEVGT